ncbi:MAG: branched-chain amino acid ABC transporter permease/ATP-binding protein [Acidimicrobiia bacterium]|nr:branched-chain amino acid ABC transporter permease/ATP-binding protein [Acidimicrobiia bacterium]
MTELVQAAVFGLGAGALYALAAQGVVLIYRGSGIINFAQGAMGMVGAYVFFELRYDGGGASQPIPTNDHGFWFALIGGVVTSALLGFLTYVLVMRPLRNASPLTRLIATLGVFTILTSAAVLEYGTDPIFIPSFYPSGQVKLGSEIVVGVEQLVVLAVVTGLTLGLWLLYRYTRFGLATTAVAESERTAAAFGWSPERIAAVNWALGAALGGLAGILIIPISFALQVSTLTNLVLAALAVALVARFTSFPVALAAGIGLGVAKSVLAHYVDQLGVADSTPFLMIILYMVFRGTALPVRGFIFDRLPALGSGRVRWTVFVPVIAGTAGLIAVLSDTWVGAITTTMIVGVILLSIVVLSGYAGQLSLGQWAVAGMGAYIAGRLVGAADVPFELAMLLGVIGTIPVGVLFALPAVRTRGVNLAIVTLGLGLTLQQVLFQNPDYTGGFTGTVVGRQSFLGIEIDSVSYPERFALFVLAAFALAGLMVARLRRGRVGRRLIAVRDNERAAASLGIGVVGVKVYAFAVASAIAALGGVLFAFRSRSVNFFYFNNFESITYVGLAVIGGIGFVIGSAFGAMLAVGALAAVFVDQVFAGALLFGRPVVDYTPLVGGLALIVVLVSDPDGMASQVSGLGHRLTSRLRRGGRRVAAEPLPEMERRRVAPRALHVEGLQVRFGAFTVVDGLSFDVGPGEIVGLIGPNGAGKTTAIDAVTGFVSASRGIVRLGEQPIAHWSAARRARAGMTRSFQSLELFEDLTVRENLRAASDGHDRLAYLTGLGWSVDPPLPAAAVAAVHDFGLEEDLDRGPRELSYGRRRLVGIARAVATEPSVLLLDEPAAGLDELETEELGLLVRRLAEDWGIGILLVDHDMRFVMTVCDRIVVLDFGQVIAQGSPDEVRTDPVVVAAYLGEGDVLDAAGTGRPPLIDQAG